MAKIFFDLDIQRDPPLDWSRDNLPWSLTQTSGADAFPRPPTSGWYNCSHEYNSADFRFFNSATNTWSRLCRPGHSRITWITNGRTPEASKVSVVWRDMTPTREGTGWSFLEDTVLPALDSEEASAVVVPALTIDTSQGVPIYTPPFEWEITHRVSKWDPFLAKSSPYLARQEKIATQLGLDPNQGVVVKDALWFAGVPPLNGWFAPCSRSTVQDGTVNAGEFLNFSYFVAGRQLGNSVNQHTDFRVYQTRLESIRQVVSRGDTSLVGRPPSSETRAFSCINFDPGFPIPELSTPV